MSTMDGKDVKISVDRTKCILCGQCVKVCPCEYLALENGKIIERADAPLGCVTCAQCAAICPSAAILVESDGISKQDVFAFPSGNASSYDGLFRLMAGRRSIRQFTDKSISLEIIDKILEPAQQAPAGLPPSTVRCIVLDGKDKVRLFAFDFLDEAGKSEWLFSEVGIWALRPFMSAEAHREMRLKVAPLYRGLIAGRKQGQDFLFYDAPLAMVFLSSSDAVDAVIACTYAMAAAEALGLGSCMIGTVAPILPWTSKSFRKKYKIPEEMNAGLGIVFGHPGIKFQRAIRRKFAGIVRP